MIKNWIETIQERDNVLSQSGRVVVAQRSVETLIGRLITDEAFRDSFVMDRLAALQRFLGDGV